jgi:hypothetical protein
VKKLSGWNRMLIVFTGILTIGVIIFAISFFPSKGIAFGLCLVLLLIFIYYRR